MTGTTEQPGVGLGVRSAEAPDEPVVRHGYAPPVLPAGTPTTALCGAPMIVEGRHGRRPPADACPLCVVVWEERRRRR